MATAFDLAGGGTDPTTTTMCWAVALLTNHVSVQERLHAEIDSVIGKQRLPTLDDRSRSVNANALSNIEIITLYYYYLHCVSEKTFVNVNVNVNVNQIFI